jgi:hypothetical protein
MLDRKPIKRRADLGLKHVALKLLPRITGA